MTLLHVSVDGPEDALLALSRGADAIHVPMGGATPETARAIVAAVEGRRPVSAGVKADLAAATALHQTDAETLEVAVSLEDADRARALAPLARSARLVGAIGIDRFDPALIRVLADSGFAGVTLDAGQGTRLFDRTDIGMLAGFADAVRASGLAFGLSGGLEPPDIPRLLLLAPDMLRLDRRPFRASAVGALRLLIPAGPPPAQDELDLRRKSSRREEPTDRVFVRDFVLPMHIGVYAREHDKTQDVRFDVDVRVLRPSHAPADMRDVFSYDIITDSIRMIAAREHVALVEGLAETIAARLLTYPRVASVTVRVEKLDTGPGGVGVEITRERPAEAATVLTLSRSGEAQ